MSPFAKGGRTINSLSNNCKIKRLLRHLPKADYSQWRGMLLRVIAKQSQGIAETVRGLFNNFIFSNFHLAVQNNFEDVHRLGTLWVLLFPHGHNRNYDIPI